MRAGQGVSRKRQVRSRLPDCENYPNLRDPLLPVYTTEEPEAESLGRVTRLESRSGLFPGGLLGLLPTSCYRSGAELCPWVPGTTLCPLESVSQEPAA